MSLNWKEIDIILRELELPQFFIKQIYQSDYRNLYVQLSSPRKNTFLRICTAQGRSRLHEAIGRPPSRGIQPRFSEFLRSRIRGGRIVSAEQIGSERIVRMSIHRAGEETLLYLKLWGNAANIIACDRSNTILESAFRRPKRGEVAGGIFALPVAAAPPVVAPKVPKAPVVAAPATAAPEAASEGSADTSAKPDKEQKERAEKLALLEPRRFHNADSYNANIARIYNELEKQEDRKRSIQELVRYFSAKEAGLKNRLRKIEGGEAENERADTLQFYADSLVMLPDKHRRGESSITLADYRSPDSDTSITILLDPRLSIQEQIDRYYAQAAKIRAQIAFAQEEEGNLRAEIGEVQGVLRGLAGDPSAQYIAQLQDSRGSEKASSRSLVEGRPGLHYFSNGFHILVGRNARENEELLRRHTRGNDSWLHTRDYPGSYVFIKHRAGKSIPLDVLLDAGNLALHHSKARNNGQADMYYTQVKHLRKPKKAKAGQVIPTQEKNIFIQMDASRLNRLLKHQDSPHGA